MHAIRERDAVLTFGSSENLMLVYLRSFGSSVCKHSAIAFSAQEKIFLRLELSNSGAASGEAGGIPRFWTRCRSQHFRWLLRPLLRHLEVIVPLREGSQSTGAASL